MTGQSAQDFWRTVRLLGCAKSDGSRVRSQRLIIWLDHKGDAGRPLLVVVELQLPYRPLLIQPARLYAIDIRNARDARGRTRGIEAIEILGSLDCTWDGRGVTAGRREISLTPKLDMLQRFKAENQPLVDLEKRKSRGGSGGGKGGTRRRRKGPDIVVVIEEDDASEWRELAEALRARSKRRLRLIRASDRNLSADDRAIVDWCAARPNLVMLPYVYDHPEARAWALSPSDVSRPRDVVLLEGEGAGYGGPDLIIQNGYPFYVPSTRVVGSQADPAVLADLRKRLKSGLGAAALVTDPGRLADACYQCKADLDRWWELAVSLGGEEGELRNIESQLADAVDTLAAGNVSAAQRKLQFASSQVRAAGGRR